MTLLLAAALFLVSGALGLGYQLVWIRKAALLVGSSQIALSTVVTSFFLGLALGSLFVGRYLRSRRWSSLFIYGIFEAGIGIFALSFPWLFGGVESAYALLYPAAAGSPAALFVLRFALLLLLFLIPTFFMGGTLPLLLDHLVRRDASVGPLTSLLYGLNVAGALVGVLGTAYVGIPLLGLTGVNFWAGLCNLGIGAVAMTVFSRDRPVHADAGREASPGLVFIGLSFASGFASLGYQMAWARYLGIFNASSVYLTAALLGVFLSALATGSLLLAGLLRRGIAPLRILAFVQPLVPILVFACLPAFLAVSYQQVADGEPLALEFRQTWALFSPRIDATVVVPLLRVALVIFVPVTLIGMGLPALIAAGARTSAALRATAGDLVFWNTLGSSAGGFAGGFLLIPLVGLSGTFLLLAIVSIGIGGFAALQSRRDSGVRGWLSPGYALAGAALLFSLFSARDDITLRALNEYQMDRRKIGSELVRVVEGPLTTGWVSRQGETLMIGANSVGLANAVRGQVSVQAVMGHLPVLFYPAPGVPRRALGIALGSGQSFGALLMYPIEELDVVDISKEIVDLSLTYFGPYQHGLASDERVRFHHDDGRHFVDRAPDAHYDVVSMEPPPPTAEGVFALYSLEFYRNVDRVLREDGVLMQWLPLYMITPEETRAIVRTQAEVFPQSFVVSIDGRDLVVLSLKRDTPPSYRTSWLEQRIEVFSRERLVAGHRWTKSSRHDLDTLEGVVSMLISGPEQVASIRAPLLHDDDQRLAYAGRERIKLAALMGNPIIPWSFATIPTTPFASLQRYFADALPVAELEEERARRHPGEYKLPLPSAFAEGERRFEQAGSARERARRAIEVAELYDSGRNKTEALRWLGLALDSHPSFSEREYLSRARRIALHGAPFHAKEVLVWIQARPEDQRQMPLIYSMVESMAAWTKREAARRDAYLF